MQEIWKDVKGYNGVYQISNLGRLKSFKKDSEGKILSNTNGKGNYFSVVLRKGDRVKSTRIHRLVAEAFIPNPDNLSEREHHFITRQQNPNVIRGLVNHNKFIRPKKVQQYSLNGELLAEYNNGKEAYLQTGVCARNIHQVASKTPFNQKGNVRKQAGGYIWKYKDEGVV